MEKFQGLAGLGASKCCNCLNVLIEISGLVDNGLHFPVLLFCMSMGNIWLFIIVLVPMTLHKK